MRVGSRWEILLDLVAAATVVVAAVQLAQPGASRSAVGIAVLAAGALLVVLRRRMPMAAALASVATSGLILLAPADALPVWILTEICLFSLPLRRPRAASTVIGGAHALLLYVGAIVTFEVGPADPLALILPVWTGAVVAFGCALRAQHDYIEALEERARATAAAREYEVRQRLGQERVRIARDLHDSVANAIAVITLQATNAENHAADDPDRARQAMQTVRTVARRTLLELGEILTVLRGDDADVDRTLPTVEGIAHVVEMFTSSGMRIEARLGDVASGALDAAASAALYRVAQEALTNAQRHGEGLVSVELRVGDDIARLEVANARGPRPAGARSGYGLIGMRERLALAGGRLDVVDEPDRFRVVAEVPLIGALGTPPRGGAAS